MRELLREKLTDVGLDPSNFGLYSLRSGGATAAANAGVPDRLFNCHGRWRSENAKDGYVKDQLSSRLEVSNSKPNMFPCVYWYAGLISSTNTLSLISRTVAQPLMS